MFLVLGACGRIFSLAIRRACGIDLPKVEVDGKYLEALRLMGLELSSAAGGIPDFRNAV